MPLYRCNHCGHIEETPAPPQQTTCAACGKPVTAYDAATLLRHVLKLCAAQSKELEELKAAQTANSKQQNSSIRKSCCRNAKNSQPHPPGSAYHQRPGHRSATPAFAKLV